MKLAITAIGSVSPVMIGAAPGVQEQEHDEHRQQRALDQRVLQTVRRPLTKSLSR
jgi:hypothetical protein